MEAEGEENNHVIHANKSSNSASTATDLVPTGEDDKRRSSV